MHKHPSHLLYDTKMKLHANGTDRGPNTVFMTDKLVYKLIFKDLGCSIRRCSYSSLDMITLLKYFNADDY